MGPIRPVDLGKLLADVPKGDWVLISMDETRVLAHSPDFDQLFKLTDEEGIVMRKSIHDGAWCFAALAA